MRAAAIALLALAVVWPTRRLLRVPLAAAGAVLLVKSTWRPSFEARHNEWAVVVGVGAAVALWWAAPRAHQRLALWGGAWWALLGSAVAVYGCVPETDQMREVGIVVAAGGVAEVLLRHRLPTSALLAAAAFVEWSALFGATGQARALAGGLFALTPIVAVAVVRDGSRWRSPAVAVVWVVAAVTMARTGGIATSLPPAVWASAVCAAAASLLTLGLVRIDRRCMRPRH